MATDKKRTHSTRRINQIEFDILLTMCANIHAGTEPKSMDLARSMCNISTVIGSGYLAGFRRVFVFVPLSVTLVLTRNFAHNIIAILCCRFCVVQLARISVCVRNMCADYVRLKCGHASSRQTMAHATHIQLSSAHPEAFTTDQFISIKMYAFECVTIQCMPFVPASSFARLERVLAVYSSTPLYSVRYSRFEFDRSFDMVSSLPVTQTIATIVRVVILHAHYVRLSAACIVLPFQSSIYSRY